jgi:hypothetical protein
MSRCCGEKTQQREDKVMIARISTTLVAIVVSGGILLSVGSPAVAKNAGFNNGSISIKREAKLIRVIRVKLAKKHFKKEAVGIFEARPGNGNETRVKRLADPVVGVGRGNETTAKRAADPVEATTDQRLRRSAQ